MYLKDHTTKSKKERNILLNISGSNINETRSENLFMKPKATLINEDLYGSTPRRVRDIDDAISKQLKKISKPEYETCSNIYKRPVESKSVNERIQRVYINSKLIIKKKQSVIIPKSNCFMPMIIPNQIAKRKNIHNLSCRDDERKDNRKKIVKPYKAYDKSVLFLPILSNSPLSPKSKVSND